MDFLTCPVALT